MSQVRILPGPPTKPQVDGLFHLRPACPYDARAALRPHPGRTRSAERRADVPACRVRHAESRDREPALLELLAEPTQRRSAGIGSSRFFGRGVPSSSQIASQEVPGRCFATDALRAGGVGRIGSRTLASSRGGALPGGSTHNPP